MKRVLLLGAGYDRNRRLSVDRPPPYPSRIFDGAHAFESDCEVYTLDSNKLCAPDFRAFLEEFTSEGGWYIRDMVPPDPGEDDLTYRAGDGARRMKPDQFDEIHAYEVLEHLGGQGDVEKFFDTFQPIWMALKPGGHLLATCPAAHAYWAWSDPGHRQMISSGSLVFLSRAMIPHPPSSDYRALLNCDWDTVWTREDNATHAFCLRAVKPLRAIPTEP